MPTPTSYIENLPDDRKQVVQEIRKVIVENLPEGFEETIQYGMLSWVVPHSIYPKGYHCDTKTPLPFLSLASQKNFISLYHMGIYAEPNLMDWFVANYNQHCKSKLDMGKSCIRFKKMDDIPFKLIGELSQKMSPAQWIDLYESKFIK
jgi:uncharacterized protein YdhG (YjbR/CyaY superfamily)